MGLTLWLKIVLWITGGLMAVVVLGIVALVWAVASVPSLPEEYHKAWEDDW